MSASGAPRPRWGSHGRCLRRGYQRRRHSVEWAIAHLKIVLKIVPVPETFLFLREPPHRRF